MKSAEEWRQSLDLPNLREVVHLPWEKWISKIQTDALRESIRIADTFALNHKLSAPEVIVAIQIREAIERLVKDIEND